jgi:hypothetical protein
MFSVWTLTLLVRLCCCCSCWSIALGLLARTVSTGVSLIGDPSIEGAWFDDDEDPCIEVRFGCVCLFTVTPCGAHPGVEHQGPWGERDDDAGAGDAFHATGAAAAVVAQTVHYEQNSIADDSSVAA